jgi:hypothetical protein
MTVYILCVCVVELPIPAAAPRMAIEDGKEPTRMSSTHFDSVLLLPMFSLLDRFIEAHSKVKTGDVMDY